MCGISGLFDTRGKRDYPRPLIERINNIQAHRGPDEAGIHLEPGIALGHRRLSIIDLATGQQPLFNEDHSVCVVFNGEIYNYQELVPELQALGHTFRTRSDTEVIVHAWEDCGKSLCRTLSRQFAFALRTEPTDFFCARPHGRHDDFYAVLDDGTRISARN